MAIRNMKNGLRLNFSFRPQVDDFQRESTGWRPFYLQRWVLFFFLVAFCGVIGALEALKEVSRVNYGLASSVQSMHYTWTYGPTAILTIVAGLWTRVEFQAKQSAPWRQMREGPAAAEKTVLLDYVSCIQPLALYQAIRNKHYLPAAAVACSLLLRLLIVFSTGLFSLKEVPILSEGVPIHLLDSLNDNNHLKYDNTSLEAFDIINAVLFENLTYPDGTNKDLLFQRLSGPGLPSDAVLNLTIDGLAADLDCEDASVTVDQWDVVTLHKAGTIWNKTVLEDIRLTTPSCNISNTILDREDPYQDKEYVVSYRHGLCDHSDGPDGERIVVTLVKLLWGNDSSPYDISFDNPGPIKKSWKIKRSLSLDRSVQLVCKPTLSQVKLQARVNVSEPLSNAHIQKVGENRPLSTSMNWMLANTSFSFANANGNSRPIDYMNPFSNANASVDMSIKLGVYLANSSAIGSIENLFKEDVLYHAAASYYRAITAQIMRIGVVEKKQSTTLGTATVNQDRVLMTSLSLRVVEVCLALIVLLVIAMVALLSRKATAGIALAPWDPNKISAIAAMLSWSDGYRDSFRGTGSASFDVLRACLNGPRYHSLQTPKGFSIAIADGGPNCKPEDPKAKCTPWRPFPNFWARVAVFCIVALVIAALELVLFLSRRYDGLGNVSTDDNLHYLWTVVPAIVMVSIGLFFGSLDFNLRCLAPYARLKQPNGAEFTESMSLAFLDSLSITTVIRSIRMRNLAVLATTLTTLVSAFLTIATSGLYSAVNVPMHTSLNFTQESVFYNSSRPPRSVPTISGYNREYEGIVISDYILRENVSFPRWTYDTLAFPELSIKKNSSRDSFADIKIPAVRSALTCELQSGAALNPNYSRVTLNNLGNRTYNYILTVDLLTRIACTDTKTKETTWLGTQSTMDIIPHSYFGEVMENSCGWNNSGHSTSYIWGYINNATDETPIQNIAALTCFDTPEIVETSTRLRLPSMDIDENHPPVPDESTAKANNRIFIPYFDPHTLASSPFEPLDNSFKALVSGRYAIPVEDLGSTNQNAKVVEAIKHQHQLMRAQQYSSWVRLAANGSLDHEPILGNITVSSRLRLMQDPVSTRVLEALLAFMLLFGMLGSTLLNTDLVLPKNPCSIAAVTSLLADSNFLDLFRDNTVDLDEKSVGESLFTSCRFYLGYLADGMEGANVENFAIHMSGSDKEGSAEEGTRI